MRYVRSLDGMRGIAVLLVVLFHYGLFPAGWSGVQLFFTLSGFLITSILLEDKALPFGAYVGRFYWRRTLRIFPLYYIFFGVTAASFAMLGAPASFEEDWVYLLSYTANFGRVREADVGPALVHTWSLAVEEQFYLVWPFLLFFLPQRAFRGVVAALLVLSPAVRLALFLLLRRWGHDEAYAGRLTYVLPFTQLDAFAAGAAIPLWRLDQLRRPGLLFVGALGLAGALGVGVLMLDHFVHGGAFVGSLGYSMFMSRHYQYVWGYSLLNAISLLAIVCALRDLSPGRFLEHPALVRVGRVSYGVYVLHVPLLFAAEALAVRLGLALHGPARALFFPVYLALLWALAEASFRWLESPFLRLKDLWNPNAKTAPRAP
jgi:peptidoglycan/LPS O-acetylase OafA/YrhL